MTPILWLFLLQPILSVQSNYNATCYNGGQWNAEEERCDCFVTDGRFCEIVEVDSYICDHKCVGDELCYHNQLTNETYCDGSNVLVADGCSINPCDNGGVCVSEVGGYSCQCSELFYGRNCEFKKRKCATSPCWNEGECYESDDGKEQFCRCPLGFEGTKCELVEGSCKNVDCVRGLCVQLTLEYSICSCPPGFGGTFCQLSIDGSATYASTSTTSAPVSTTSTTAVTTSSAVPTTTTNSMHQKLPGSLIVDLRLLPETFINNLQRILTAIAAQVKADTAIRKVSDGPMVFELRNDVVGDRVAIPEDKVVKAQYKKYNPTEPLSLPSSNSSIGVRIYLEIDIVKCLVDCYESVDDVADRLSSDSVLESLSQIGIPIGKVGVEKRTRSWALEVVAGCALLALVVFALFNGIALLNNRKRTRMIEAPFWIPPLETDDGVIQQKKAKRQRMECTTEVREVDETLDELLNPLVPKKFVNPKPAHTFIDISRLEEALSPQPFNFEQVLPNEVNVQDIDGNTPLINLAKSQTTEQFQTKMALVYFRYGADVNMKNKFSETALFLATSNNHVALVRELLRFGADPSIEDETGSTCLQKAVRNESLEMCRMILEHEKYRTSRSDGDDVSLIDSVDVNNLTALMIAVRDHVDTDIAKLLMERGADPCFSKTSDTASHDKRSALHHAVVANNYRHVKLLCKVITAAGKNVDLVDQEDATPLFLAAKNGNQEIVDLLLSFKASTGQLDGMNRRPAEIARWQGHLNLSDYLRTRAPKLAVMATNIRPPLKPIAVAMNPPAVNFRTQTPPISPRKLRRQETVRARKERNQRRPLNEPNINSMPSPIPRPPSHIPPHTGIFGFANDGTIPFSPILQGNCHYQNPPTVGTPMLDGSNGYAIPWSHYNQSGAVPNSHGDSTNPYATPMIQRHQTLLMTHGQKEPIEAVHNAQGSYTPAVNKTVNQSYSASFGSSGYGSELGSPNCFSY